MEDTDRESAIRTYHWLLTVQLNAPGVVSMTTTYGVYKVAPGQTRSQVFKELYDSAITQAQEEGRSRALHLASPVCTFFSLEPDEFTQAGGQ